MNKKASIKAKVFKDNKSKCKATCAKKEINSTYVCTLTGKEIDSKYVRINVIHSFHFFLVDFPTQNCCVVPLLFFWDRRHINQSVSILHIYLQFKVALT